MVDFRLSIAVVIGIILSSIIITSAVFVITSNGGSETSNTVSYTKDNSGLHEISNTDLYTKDNTGLTVTGRGVVGADPDVVEINLGVEVIAKTVGSANEKASTSMSRLQKVISQYDIEDDDFEGNIEDDDDVEIDIEDTNVLKKCMFNIKYKITKKPLKSLYIIINSDISRYIMIYLII